MSDLEPQLVCGLAGDLLRVTAHAERLGTLYEVLGEFNHLVRNRLNSLKLSLYLASRDGQEPPDERWSELDRQYRAIEAFVDRLQTIYRPMTLSPMRVAVGLLFDERHAAWAERFQARQVRFVLNSPRDSPMGYFDPIRLGQGFDALASWRGATAEPNSLVQVDWAIAEGDVVVDWREPNVSGFPLVDASETGVSSLALPLLTRIITAHGGRFATSREDGLWLQFRWPLEARAA